MAGENPGSYEGVSSTKLVNKEGLLELCGQIKTAIASAGGGSGSSGSNWTVLDPMTTIYSESFSSNQTTLNDRILGFVSDYRTDTYYSDSLFQQKVVCRNGNSIIFYIEFLPCNMQQSNPQKRVGLICQQIVWNGTLDNDIRQTYYGYIWTAGSNHYISWYNEYYPSADLPTLSSTILGDLNTNKVGCLEVYKASAYTSPIVRWRTKADFKNDLDIPSLPTDPSSDGDYVLQNTISLGTSTLSWGTPSSGGGGGTTYTAGTGIDIDANNEISVDATDLSYNDLQDKPTIPTVPTNISAFTNDAGYLTSHQSLTGYATQNYVDSALSQVPSYSAGTGISIDANGVISLALANASQEVM